MLRVEIEKAKMADKYKVIDASGREDSDLSDMHSVNKRLLSGLKPKKLHMRRSDRRVEVDYTTGDIYLDSEKVNLGLKSKPKEFRWINFNRVYVGYGDNGKATESKICVIGWQSTVNGKNIKRMVAVYPNGRAELWKENDEVIAVL